jgi:hypothetical protein
MEVMMTTLWMGTMFAIALPAGKAALDSLELSNATRDVERELQTARMRAVSANQPMRVKFNCPADGHYRLVEVTGIPATDNAGSRCDETLFGYHGPKDKAREHDDPLRRVGSGVNELIGPELEFLPVDRHPAGGQRDGPDHDHLRSGPSRAPRRGYGIARLWMRPDGHESRPRCGLRMPGCCGSRGSRRTRPRDRRTPRSAKTRRRGTPLRPPRGSVRHSRPAQHRARARRTPAERVTCA